MLWSIFAWRENMLLRPKYEYIRFLYGESRIEYIRGPCVRKYSLSTLERSALRQVSLKWVPNANILASFSAYSPVDDYKRGPVSMKDQDSLWIINTRSWYYKFSKSIVISFFTLSYLLLLSSHLYGDCARHSRHLTLPFQPGPH